MVTIPPPGSDFTGEVMVPCIIQDRQAFLPAGLLGAKDQEIENLQHQIETLREEREGHEAIISNLADQLKRKDETIRVLHAAKIREAEIVKANARASKSMDAAILLRGILDKFAKDIEFVQKDFLALFKE